MVFESLQRFHPDGLLLQARQRISSRRDLGHLGHVRRLLHLFAGHGFAYRAQGEILKVRVSYLILKSLKGIR